MKKKQIKQKEREKREKREKREENGFGSRRGAKES